MGSGSGGGQLRSALGRGDFARAEQLLGHPYTLGGVVVRGRLLGRKLGAPTANISLAGQDVVLQGTYVATVQGVGADRPAMVHVGTRPSVGGEEVLLEVHVLDFEGDLYGHALTVRFMHKVSDEEKLDSLEALERKIGEDLRLVRAFLDTTRDP